VDDLFLVLIVLVMVAVTVWATLRERAKKAQAAELIEGFEPDVQSKTVQDLGIAIATLESVFIDLGAARVEEQPDPALLGQARLAAQSQIHEVQMQVEDALGHLPEANPILDALTRIPSLADTTDQGLREAAETMSFAKQAVRETIGYLEATRSRVRAEEEAAGAEQLLTARLEAEVRHTEALEAAREAGTLSAPAHRKERS
jgi:hypothetical protein